MPAGRPTKYDQIKDNLPKVQELAANGFTDEEICKSIGISTTSFYEYKNKYPEFAESLKNGKVNADNQVIQSLFKRAIGYEFVEEHLEYVPGSDNSKTLIKSVKKVKKQMAGDVMAMIYWLNNRRKLDWKYRHTEESGSLSDEQIEKLRDIANKKTEQNM